MWQFKDKKDLLAVAFIDAETYIHTAQSVKGFILTGDISRSIQLLHYNEGRRSLSLISQVLAMIYQFNELVLLVYIRIQTRWRFSRQLL